jgi:hypothetical protein
MAIERCRAIIPACTHIKLEPFADSGLQDTLHATRYTPHATRYAYRSLAHSRPACQAASISPSVRVWSSLGCGRGAEKEDEGDENEKGGGKCHGVHKYKTSSQEVQHCRQ